MEDSSEEVTSREPADLTRLRHAESDLLVSEARMFVDFAADAFMVHTEDGAVAVTRRLSLVERTSVCAFLNHRLSQKRTHAR